MLFSAFSSTDCSVNALCIETQWSVHHLLSTVCHVLFFLFYFLLYNCYVIIFKKCLINKHFTLASCDIIFHTIWVITRAGYRH